MKTNDVKVILAAHDAHWEDRRDEMERYKSVYEMEFWEKQKNPSQIRIQTNDGYGYIESFQASLFAKNPAIVLKAVKAYMAGFCLLQCHPGRSLLTKTPLVGICSGILVTYIG